MAKLINKGDTLKCPECNYLVIEALQDIHYGDLMTVSLIQNKEQTLKNGDKVMCPNCGKQDLWMTEPSRWNVDYKEN